MNIEQVLNSFEHNENPTREEVANAYYARDVSMHLSFQTQFEWAMKKLHYHPSTYESIKNSLFRKKTEAVVKDFLNDPANPPNASFQQLYTDAVNEAEVTVGLRRTKWQHFSNFLNNDDHIGFYLAMDSSELAYLGW